MKKVYALIIYIIVVCNGVVGQEFTGVHTSPYLPFVALINQPAELVRSDTKWNIHFLSAQAGLINSQSFSQADFWDIMGQAGFNDLKFFFGAEESLLYVKGRVVIPSITYKYNKNNAFGLTMSMRADGVYNSSNDDFKNIFTGITNPEGLVDIKDEYFKSLVNSWVEYNLTWSKVIVHSDNRLLTGGLSLKFLNGSGSGYLEMDGIDVKFDTEYISHFDMEFSYGFNESLSESIDGGDIVNQSGDFGFGMDLGLSYSYQPDNYKGVEGAPYKYKLGFIISDYGSITHQKTKNQASYRVSMNDVPYSRFKGIETLEALKDSIEKSVDIDEISGDGFKTKLPLSLAVNIDYCLKPKFFLNGTFLYRPNYYSSTVDIVSNTIWRANVTPRYESDRWGFFLPISYSSVLGGNMGLAARYKSFFIGSSTIVGNIVNVGNGQGHVYFGASIPIGTLGE